VVNGNLVLLSREPNPNSNNGPESGNAHGLRYVLQTLDTTGKVRAYDPTTYPASAGNRTLVTYQLPDDAKLKVAGYTGSDYTFTSTLHVDDSDNTDTPPTRCGNAAWSFTHDGKNVSNGGTSCGENSFYGFTPIPSDGKVNVKSNPRIAAFYTDESPMQMRDVTDTYWQSQPGDYGVDFSYTPLGGQPVQIKPSTITAVNATTGLTVPVADNYNQPPTTPPTIGGYWLEDPALQQFRKDKYNTTIYWNAAGLTDGTYTINLKLYDTDNNKPGNDCGVMTWTISVTGNPGEVRLIE